MKLDSAEQLLLSEGVCRQLGIIQYHPDVWVAAKGGYKCNNHQRYLYGSRSEPRSIEECTESGTYSPHSSNHNHSLPPSEERTESGTTSPHSSDQTHNLPPRPSEEPTESGTTSPHSKINIATTKKRVINITRNAHAHILPRACQQPMRKQSRLCACSTDCVRSQTSYESVRTAEIDIPKRD